MRALVRDVLDSTVELGVDNGEVLEGQRRGLDEEGHEGELCATFLWVVVVVVVVVVTFKTQGSNTKKSL